MGFRSGFIAVVGRPNVGKSTLINRVLGEKITITSDKPQTTRNRIQLIATDEESQMIFLDTPGIQKPKNALGKYMYEVSVSTLTEVDVVLCLVDTTEYHGPLEELIFSALKKVKGKTPIILGINKIDQRQKEEILPLIAYYDGLGIFDEIIPLSAQEGENVDRVMETLKSHLPEGPLYYPEDMVTDQPEKFVVSELVREKALEQLSQEVPHGIAVAVESMKPRKDKDLVDVEATIFVERESHKAIVIGKKGARLKSIGIAARRDIEALLGSRVNLSLWVKVVKNWREKEETMKRFGYR